MPNSSMAVISRTEPAGTMSARFASRPGMRVRAAAGRARMRSWTMARSLRRTDSWLIDSGSGPLRAAAMLARSHSVPLVPTSICGRRSAISAATGASSEVTRRRSRRTSSASGGSCRTSSALNRATPNGRLADHSSLLWSPTVISRLPPPRSRQSAGGWSIRMLACTAAKISRASSWPLMTSTRTPVRASMRSTTAGELSASRMALVAKATNSSAPAASASAFSRRTESITCSAARSVTLPSRLTTSPSRNISFSRTSVSK